MLRRGLLAALGAIGIFLGGTVAVAAICGLVGLDVRAALGVLVLAGGIVISVLGSGAFFAAFALALEKPPTVREAFGRALECSAEAAPSIFFAIFPGVMLPASFWTWLLTLSGHPYPGVAAGDRASVLLGMLAAAVAAAWVWSDYVVLPVAAVFVDRVGAKESQARAHAVFRASRLRLLLVTNAPSVLVAAAIPTGPLQDRLEAVLTARTLLVVRMGVGATALVCALVLHAAVAVAAYASATRES